MRSVRGRVPRGWRGDRRDIQDPSRGHRWRVGEVDVRGIREPVTGPAARGARRMRRWQAPAAVRVCPVLDLIPLTTL
ncbi:hypothetical protein GCM10025762_37860 [Haloechinothrix salitolerans]